MAMLAERKQKQKWLLQPRGNSWTADTNKFGQKLLEKMGWSEGKGLGANQDGKVDPVKVSYKNDIKGLGFKENTEQWTEHEDKFSELLESLKNSENATVITVDKVKPKSLEEQSKKSRARVHYKKFTRGKDLSRYSEKDLANIFGRKSLETEKKVKIEPEAASHEIHGGSSVDYFSRKQVKVNVGVTNGLRIGANGVLQTDVDDSYDSRAGFGSVKMEIESRTGFGSFKTDESYEYKSRAGFGSIKTEIKSECENEAGVTNRLHNHDSYESRAGFGSIKKEIKSESENEVTNGLHNHDVYESRAGFGSIKTEIKSENEYEAGVTNGLHNHDSYDSKAGFGSIKMEIEPEYENKTDTDNINKLENNNGYEFNYSSETSYYKALNKSNDESKIKKKKSKKRKSEDLESYENNNAATFISYLQEDAPKENCNKKRKIDDEDIADINKGVKIEEDIVMTPKKLKKKKKEKEVGNTNNAFNHHDSIDSNISITDNNYEIKTNDISYDDAKKAKNGLDNNAFNDLDGNESNISTTNNIYEVNPLTQKEAKRLRKQLKKQRKLENGSINNAFNSLDSNEITTNNTYEVNTLDVNHEDPKEAKRLRKLLKKQQKNENNSDSVTNLSYEVKNFGLDNPVFDETVKEEGENLKVVDEIDRKEEKRLKKLSKKQKKLEGGLFNPGFMDLNEMNEVTENVYEVKLKKKKKQDKEEAKEVTASERKGLDNPGLNLNDTFDGIPLSDDIILNASYAPTPLERGTKRKNEQNGLDNPALNLNDSIDIMPVTPNIILNSILTPQNKKRGDKRKSVRFSEVNEEYIIPPNITPDSSPNNNDGIANLGFNGIQENIDDINNKIATYQAQIENDMNEAKWNNELSFVGEEGPGVEAHEAVDDGVRLSFKSKTFSNCLPNWLKNKNGPHSSYKHLIKGDVVIGFKNSNLHEIVGYATGSYV